MDVFKQQQSYFNTDETKSYAFRKAQLLSLKANIEKHQAAIEKALYQDLKKSSFEAYATEIGYVLYSINKTIKKLKKWMKPTKVKSPFFLPLSSSKIYHEPKGVVLIVGPYNYPFQLVIEPLIGAIAAGNTAIIKPSEFPTHTEKIIEMLIKDTFASNYVHVITGDKEVTSQLLKQPFDHVFFTGSHAVGKIVYQAAAKHLTPVTLELGGKSPAIIDQTANLKVAAKRIVFGKFINAGQTCIAPDYILVHEAIKEAFLNVLKNTTKTFYPEGSSTVGHIINQKHYERLMSLIDIDKVVLGGKHNKDTKYIEPTILDGVTEDDAIMQEEIFGPLLPIITYKDEQTMINTLKTKDKPLALYVFTSRKNFAKQLIHTLSFGGGAINDTILHVANPNLPFGGIGKSGMGSYHGIHSFKTFSHQKSVINKKTWFDPPLAYPPYTQKKESLIKRIMK